MVSKRWCKESKLEISVNFHDQLRMFNRSVRNRSHTGENGRRCQFFAGLSYYFRKLKREFQISMILLIRNKIRYVEQCKSSISKGVCTHSSDRFVCFIVHQLRKKVDLTYLFCYLNHFYCKSMLKYVIHVHLYAVYSTI